VTHRILVTAVGGNIGQGVVKALRAGRRDYFIAGTDMEPRSAGFALVDRAYTVPAAGAESLTARLIEIIEADRIEAVCVCSPAELTFFGRARGALEAATGVRILVNPEPVLRVGQDKLETARFLERHGFPYPETAAASDAAAVEGLIERWGFPVIVKPRLGWAATNVLRLDSRAAIETACTLVPDGVVQRYLPSDAEEYTAGVVGSAATRRFAWIVLRRELQQGTTYRTELAQDPAVGARIVAMAQALGVEGVCNFQFRLEGGEPFVFEINPRFSGTSGIRYLYGFNDPEMAFEHACLGRSIEQPEVRPGVVLRYWNEIHLPGADFASVRSGGVESGRQIVVASPRERAARS
jgi:carbamoyl-phosphate synthase large subunit